MAPLKVIVLFTYLVAVNASESILEKHCTKFEFEEKVLEKLIRLDIKVDQSLQNMELAIKAMQSSQNDMLEQYKAFRENTDNKVELMLTFKEKVETSSDEIQQMTEEFKKEMETKHTQFTVSLSKKLDEDLKTNLRISQVTIQQFMESINQTANTTIKQLDDKIMALIGDKVQVPSAFIAHDPGSSDLTKNAALIYSTVLLNLGDGYDATTGKFTATVTGMYIFSAQICGKKGNYTQYQLIVNNIVNSASQQYDNDREGVCSSVTTVAFLRSGEDVWVKCVSGGSQVVTDNEQYWNTFVGILVNSAIE